MTDLHRKTKDGAVHRDDSLAAAFTVSFDYPVHFTDNLFDTSNKLFAATLDRLHEKRQHRAVVYLDSNVSRCHPRLIPQITAYFETFSDRLFLSGAPHIVPGGPTTKSELDIVKDIMTVIGNLHLDRQSFVVAVGGGAVLDMVGFAASLVHRGLRLIRIPSTTLAQDDAGVGVKNGMDVHGQKNFLGTFSPPFAVLNDFSLLSTLSDKDWCGGISEAFKVAIIKDADFFEFLCSNAGRLKQRDQTLMEQAIRRCAEIHVQHICTSGDPFEFGSARPLDFGHWAAHQLENMSEYTIGHGQAVAIGIALDSYYAAQKGMIGEADLRRILEGITAAGLPVYHPLLAQRNSGTVPDEKTGDLAVLKGLSLLREHLGGILNVTLPEGIGKKIELHKMDNTIIENGVVFLETWSRKHETE